MRAPSEIFNLDHPFPSFKNEDFTTLFTVGGDIVEGENQYNALMELLKGIGEKRFYFHDDPNGLIGSDKVYTAQLDTSSTYQDFMDAQILYDKLYLFSIANILFYGDTDDWAMYLCERPTTIIIGCKPEFANGFKHVYKIKGNGLDEEGDFIRRELLYDRDPETYNMFRKAYKLEGSE